MKTNKPGKILTATQAAEFLGMSLSYLYKLTHNRTLAYFKPNGKMLYFLESDLVAWVTSNRISPVVEIEQQTGSSVCKKRKANVGVLGDAILSVIKEKGCISCSEVRSIAGGNTDRTIQKLRKQGYDIKYKVTHIYFIDNEQ